MLFALTQSRSQSATLQVNSSGRPAHRTFPENGSVTLRIWLPSGYSDPSAEKKKYPTLYMLDGQNAFDDCTAYPGEHELQADETVTETDRDTDPGAVRMAEALASNLKGAYFKHPEVMLVVQPGAKHSSRFWAQRLPGAIQFLYGDSEPGK